MKKTSKNYAWILLIVIFVIVNVLGILLVIERSPNFYIEPIPHESDAPKVTKKRLSAPVLDFFIVGFPKCGSSTLRYTFQHHNETVIPQLEYCDIDKSRVVNYTQKLSKIFQGLSSDPSVKRGIKCPVSIKKRKGLERLSHSSPNTKIIIGVRQPVLFFQSFYNYRITEIYTRKMKKFIPSPNELVGGKEWKGVSTEMARFHLYMMQLNKTRLTKRDEGIMAQRNLKLIPNRFQVFLYTMEQLQDEDENRSARFRKDLQVFLDIKGDVEPFSVINKNHLKGWPESMNICDDKNRALRMLLLSHAKASKDWILNKFIQSKDVTIGGREHFKDILRNWTFDPCGMS